LIKKTNRFIGAGKGIRRNKRREWFGNYEVAVALLSIIPTIEFLSWRKAVNAGRAPGRARSGLIYRLLLGAYLNTRKNKETV
jgi:hypothetical protein